MYVPMETFMDGDEKFREDVDAFRFNYLVHNDNYPYCDSHARTCRKKERKL
jgi:hypothetical protein